MAKSAAGAVLIGVVLAGGLAATGDSGESGAGALADKLAAKQLAASGAGNPWALMGMSAGAPATRATADCAALSDDQIRAFFRRTPCRSLDRTLYPVTLGDGTVVAVSLIWVGFATAAQAQDFADLHFIHGNGDIDPLPTALLGLEPVTFTALNYDSRVVGTSVVFAETEAAEGTADPEVLDTIAEIAVAFPRR